MRTLRILATLLATLTACDGSSSSEPVPALASGTYALVAVSGRGPATGVFIVSNDGDAERRVRSRLPSGELSAEYVARGTIAVRTDGTIDLQLREDSGRAVYIWRPAAYVQGGALVLRHPDPADGPDIVETYRRE